MRKPSIHLNESDAQRDAPRTLMDQVHAWTFASKMRGRKVGDAYTVQLRIRELLKIAQRFTLDDDSVTLISQLNDEGDKPVGPHHEPKLMGWSFLARLPYDCVWFEYSNKAKVDAAHALGRGHPWNPDDPLNSEKLGYLMYREEPSAACQRWVCHVFYGGRIGAWPAMFAFVFDPEGDARFPVKGSSVWKEHTISVSRLELRKRAVRVMGEDGLLERSIVADAEVLLGGFAPYQDGKMEQPDWVSPRLAVIVDPWWARLFTQMPLEQQQRAMETDLHEQTGHIRWIVSMLAAINQLPRGVKPAQSRSGKQCVGMHQLEYFRHSNLTIELPRENRLIRAHKLLDRATRNSQRAWHMVIGHWRVIEFHKRQFLCRHVPTMVGEGLGMCERCGLLVRWIPAHSRGDATIGVVDHAYKVTA